MSTNNVSSYTQLSSYHEQQTEARAYYRRPGKRLDSDEKLKLTRDPKKPKRNNEQKLKRLRYKRRILNRAAHLAELKFEARERADIAREVRFELEQERREEYEWLLRLEEETEDLTFCDIDCLHSDEELENELRLDLCSVATEEQTVLLQLKGKDFEAALESYYNSQFSHEQLPIAS